MYQTSAGNSKTKSHLYHYTKASVSNRYDFTAINRPRGVEVVCGNFAIIIYFYYALIPPRNGQFIIDALCGKNLVQIYDSIVKSCGTC